MKRLLVFILVLPVLLLSCRWEHGEQALLEKASNIYGYVLFMISVLIFLVAMIFFIKKDNRQKRRIAEQQQLLEHKEKTISQLSQELEKVSLHSRREALINVLENKIMMIQQEVVSLRSEKFNSSPIVRKIKRLSRKIIAGTDKSPLTSKDWELLMDIAGTVYMSIATYLHKEDCHLSQTELRYCYLSLLQLETNEEAVILNITLESVRKTRARVRQRLEIIGSEQTICGFLLTV